MPAVGTLLQNHQTKGFYHHRRSSLCAFVSLHLSFRVWMWALGVVVVLSEIHEGMKRTWACVCIFNAISWSHTSAQTDPDNLLFFSSFHFFASFQSLCLFQWDILRTFCVQHFSFLFLFYFSLSHWMPCLCATVFTLCNFSFSKVIFWCDGAVSSL